MPDLDFHIESCAPVPFAATPMLGFGLAVTNSPAEEPVHSVALRCQIQIEATRRRYSPRDQEQLRDLFGEPDRWSQTLRNMLWTNTAVTVGPFTGGSVVELQVPCTFDFNVAATKYFHSLENADVPLCFLFSGTVFYETGEGIPQVAPISWSREARFRLPVETWRALMASYYPNTAWLCLRRDVFDRLHQYKIRHGIPTWEAAFESLLPDAAEGQKEVVRPCPVLR